MMRSLFSGVSGLKAHQTRMDVIGNNIANINTIGFKSSRTTFSDMLSQVQRSASAPTEGRGGVNPRQIGLGVDLESIDLIFTDSSPQQTGKNTDLALSGNGLFVLKDGNQSFYTRNGAFMFDEQGYYVMPGNGLRVQGWNAADGVINTNGAATDIIVEVGKTMEATATDAINYNGNLNKQEPTIVKISYITAPDVDPATAFAAVGTGTTDNPTSINVDGVNVIAATITFSDGSDPLHVTSGYYEVGRTVPVTTLAEIYDSQGGRHEVTVLIDKDSTTADADANTEALETATTTASFYTDGDNIEHRLTVLSATDTIYEDTNGNYYPASEVTATAWVLTSDNTQAVLQDTTGYYYMDANNNRVDVAASDVTVSAGTVVTDSTTDPVTTENVTLVADPTTVGKYTDNNGDTHYVALTDASVDTRNVYDNRWRMYLAPQVGQKGPAAAAAGETYSNEVTNTESDGSTITATMNGGTTATYLYFDSNGKFITNGRSQDASIDFTYGNGNGAGDNTAAIDLTRMTQYANSTTSFPVTNGNAAGILQSIAIDGNGIISGTYTNGLVRAEAQIAVAQFNNASGLTKVGTTIYQESNNSGLANVKTISDFGLSVVASALEMSNVDLATEFSDMIITQRGFQANSKMTTVSYEMLETLVNMKR